MVHVNLDYAFSRPSKHIIKRNFLERPKFLLNMERNVVGKIFDRKLSILMRTRFGAQTMKYVTH